MKYLSETLIRALEQRAKVDADCMPLESPRLSAKLLFAPKTKLDTDAVIATFRSWIKEHALPGDLAIDVVSYRHVFEGPALMLVGADAHYVIDGKDGRLGLRYARRRSSPGSGYGALVGAIEATLTAALLLERDAGIRFDTDLMEIEIDDRLTAPNTRETFEHVTRVLGPLVLTLFEGGAIEPASMADPKAPFRVRIHGVRERMLDELIGRIAFIS